MGRKSVEIFALFAVICVALGRPDENCEEKALECQVKLIEIMFGDLSSEDEACQKLRGVGDCLRNVADECVDEEDRPEVEEAFKEFEGALDKNCQGDEIAEDDSAEDDSLEEALQEIFSGNDVEERKKRKSNSGRKKRAFVLKKRTPVPQSAQSAENDSTEDDSAEDDSLEEVLQEIFSGNDVDQRKKRNSGRRKRAFVLKKRTPVPQSAQSAEDDSTEDDSSEDDMLEEVLQEIFSGNDVDLRKKRHSGRKKRAQVLKRAVGNVEKSRYHG